MSGALLNDDDDDEKCRVPYGAGSDRTIIAFDSLRYVLYMNNAEMYSSALSTPMADRKMSWYI